MRSAKRNKIMNEVGNERTTEGPEGGEGRDENRMQKLTLDKKEDG